MRAIRRRDLQRVIAAEMTGTGEADAKRFGLSGPEHFATSAIRRRVSRNAPGGEAATGGDGALLRITEDV